MKRSASNPVLTRADIPDVPPRAVDVSSVFNPGACFRDGRVALLLRVQTRGRETVWMLAESDDGVAFEVRPGLLSVEGLPVDGREIFHAYDPRITVVEGRRLVVFAADTVEGCRLGTAEWTDDDRLVLIGLDRRHDARNGVLFPEKRDGRWLRLERPNRVAAAGVASGDEIWLAESDDLVTWRPVRPILSGRPHSWDELIGSGPPPVKTREGWLHIYHGVATHFASSNIYQAGVCLLDLNDPSRVVARGRNNILEPREMYELIGQVPNVVFPSGWIVDDLDDEGFAAVESPVRLYYGAADTCIGLAETTIGWLIDQARLQ